MAVDPWIQDHSIMTFGANQLKIDAKEGLEDLSHGSVMWKGQVGHQTAPMWHRPAWHVGPLPPYHIHLPSMCVFVTILAKILAYKYISMYKWN